LERWKKNRPLTLRTPSLEMGADEEKPHEVPADDDMNTSA
jgi:hypothetical protein